MAQEFEQFTSQERLSDEEVEAIVKRYGERETGGGHGPTVADVAETLQVDEATVRRMLREIRQSQSERQLEERLNRLEMENEDLRRRASEGYVGEMFTDRHWMSRRAHRRRRAGLIVAVAIGAFIASRGPGVLIRLGLVPVIVLLALVGLIVWTRRRDP